MALAVLVLYAALCVAFLPSSEWPRTLLRGVLVFALVAVTAHTFGRGPVHGPSVLAVAFASGAVLVVPTFPAMGGTTPAAVPIGFLGMQAAVLLWAALRWRPRVASTTRVPFGTAARTGALAALGLSLIAAIPVTIAAIRGEARGGRVLLVFPAYFAGLLGAATAYWLLQRIAHLATGRYLIGVLGGTCVYGAVAPVVALFEREPLSFAKLLAVAAVCGGLVGPAVALNSTDDVPAT